MSPSSACLWLLFSVEVGHGGGGIGPAAPASRGESPAATASAKAAAGSTAPTPLAQTLARIDELQRRRDEPAALAEEQRLVDGAAARAGNDYAVLWRAARMYFWLSDDPSRTPEQRSTWGKKGWDLAERAIAANPGEGAGYYWAAVNMGSYALGLGVMKALTMGMEGKFTSRLEKAGQLVPGYEHGAIDVAWGRFYEKLPWPKRDRKKAEQHLRRVLTAVDPNNLRARVFLADTLLHDDRADEAKRLLEQVIAAPVGRYDPPEERRAKALAKGMLAGLPK